MTHRILRHLEREVGSKTVAWIIILTFGISLGSMMVNIGLYLSLRDTQDDVSVVADGNEQTSGQLVQAVCTLRADYTKRINDTQDFLEQHPNGFDLPGSVNDITAAQLRLNVANLRRTRHALTSVDCQGVKVPKPLSPPIPPVSSGG